MWKTITEFNGEENTMTTEKIYRHATKVYDIIYGIEQPMPDIPFYHDYAIESTKKNLSC